MARVNISLSDELEKDVRVYLAESGVKRGGLSEFVENAVSSYLLRLSIAKNHELNKDMTEREAMDLVDEELAQLRKSKRDKGAGHTGH